MFSTTTVFGTPRDVTLAEIAIESFYPSDTQTADYFDRPPRSQGLLAELELPRHQSRLQLNRETHLGDAFGALLEADGVSAIFMPR